MRRTLGNRVAAVPRKRHGLVAHATGWRVVACVLAVLVMSGCASGEAQVRLLEVARKGIGEVRAAQEGRQKLVESLMEGRRRQLDEAFDEDVRRQDQLTAEWVIEARRAYAVGLAGMHAQAAAAERAHEGMERTLAAVEAALRRVEAIQSAYLQWWEEVSR